MKTRLTCAVLLLVLAGCAGIGEQQRGPEITADALLSGTALGSLTLPSPPPESAILQLDPAMQAFLQQNVSPTANDGRKLRQLVAALIGPRSFGFDYDERTRTARETFRAHSGNCMSFTNLFVALAREAGLNVAYQEVDVPPDWTRSGDSFVLNLHVNALVRLVGGRRAVVDFRSGDVRDSYDRRRISDRRAMAHFYNNIGAEFMLAGQAAEAFASFRKALRDNDPDFAPAWDNLATLYLREGQPAYAEAAYWQALRIDHWDFLAMSNLARLYQRQGRVAEAAEFRKRAATHRMRNPYYRYHLARKAFLAHDYDQAIRHLRYALRRKPDEAEFKFLLGLTYLQKGNQTAAMKALDRAESLAATDRARQAHHSALHRQLPARSDFQQILASQAPPD